MNSNMNFGEKERLTDTLTSQKFITSTYNSFASECESDELNMTMLKLLADEHKIQHAVWKEMNSRGWYTTEKAEQNKIEQEKTKFSSVCNKANECNTSGACNIS